MTTVQELKPVANVRRDEAVVAYLGIDAISVNPDVSPALAG